MCSSEDEYERVHGERWLNLGLCLGGGVRRKNSRYAPKNSRYAPDMGVEPKIGGFESPPKMDGENNGKPLLFHS